MPFSYVVSRVLDAYPDLDAKQVERRLAYGSFASIRDRFIYIDVPKAGSTAMKMLFREVDDSTPLRLTVIGDTRRIGFVHERENVPFPPLTALSDKDQRELLEARDVLRFTVVRNPYSRLVSAWRQKVFLCDPSVDDVYSAVRGEAPPIGKKDPVKFSEFVSYIENTADRVWNWHWQRQVDLTFPKSLSFTHLGKVETLETTIKIFTQQLKHNKSLNIPRSNEAVIRPAPKLSAELAARIYSLYEEDFTTFGYEAESWPRDQEDDPSIVSEERFIDEIIERNLVIGHSHAEIDRLRREYDAAYRFSLARIQSKLRRIVASRD